MKLKNIFENIADKIEDAMIEFMFAFPRFPLYLSIISFLISIYALYIKWSK